MDMEQRHRRGIPRNTCVERMLRWLRWADVLLVALVASVRSRPLNVRRMIFNRAVEDFERGRFAESAAGFDRLVKIAPESAPQLWQRGIALYYAGLFKDCRAQFELHRTVNPDDVENAFWHFLCVARAESPETGKSGASAGRPRSARADAAGLHDASGQPDAG